MSLNEILTAGNASNNPLNVTFKNLIVTGTYTGPGIPGPPGPPGPTVTIPPTSVAFGDSSSHVTGDATQLSWNESNPSLTVTLPSSNPTLSALLVLNSDPSGDHGFGSHISLKGNPAGGATISRDDGGANNSFVQIYGGDYSGTTGGQIYLNGNNSSESGDPGAVQVAMGMNGTNIQLLGPPPNYPIYFAVNDTGGSVGNISCPQLTPNMYVGTDGSSNLVSVGLSYTPAAVMNWNGSAPTSVQNALDRVAAQIGPIS
jgi:hypothetical protein